MTLPRAFVPQRDVQQTGFTESLRLLVAEVPGLHAIAFCDADGETIDYHSYLDPFDIKVAGAVMGLLLSFTARECPRFSQAADPRDLVIRTDAYVLFVRRLVGGYCLTGVLAADALLGKLLSGLDAVEAKVLAESGL